jgi:hypothetical protein
VKDVAFGLPLFFALMIEMVSAFGPVGIAAYAEATRPAPTLTDMARPVATQPAIARDGETQRDINAWQEVGHVVRYIADRTEPRTTGAALGAADLCADYRAWCVSNRLEPLSDEQFLREFDRLREAPQLVGKIRKFGPRYFGIGLVDHGKLAVLPHDGTADIS